MYISIGWWDSPLERSKGVARGFPNGLDLSNKVNIDRAGCAHVRSMTIPIDNQPETALSGLTGLPKIYRQQPFLLYVETSAGLTPFPQAIVRHRNGKRKRDYRANQAEHLENESG